MSESKDLAMKNAYSNYDDHCTVVVAIEYAFFKWGIFGRIGSGSGRARVGRAVNKILLELAPV
mgnify:CR=1 FL=1